MNEIHAYIDDRVDWLVDTTVSLIRTPSVSGDEGAVAALLTEIFKKEGFSFFTDAAGNVVAGIDMPRRAGPGEKILALNVHLDTVPPGISTQWRHGPFSGTVEDGRIYGRGACDTKGAWAPMILAMEAVRQTGVPLKGQVLFTGVVMEETTYGIGIKVLLEDTLKDYRPDYIVLGEPTNLDIAIGHRGRTEIEIALSGRSCHASTPQKGDNAIYKAAWAIRAVEELANTVIGEVGDPRLGTRSLAVTDIVCTPAAHNVIPDGCTFFIDYRLLPGETVETVEEALREAVEMAGVGGVISIPGKSGKTYTGMPFYGKKFMAAYRIDEGHTLVQETKGAVIKALGREPVIRHWQFATDGAWSMGVLGIPTIGFSPCEERLAHVIDEHVRIDSMKEAAKVYAAMILRLLG